VGGPVGRGLGVLAGVPQRHAEAPPAPDLAHQMDALKARVFFEDLDEVLAGFVGVDPVGQRPGHLDSGMHGVLLGCELLTRRTMRPSARSYIRGTTSIRYVFE
jgi:hypothetical protein